MPEEAVYKKVDTGREGERVYLMEIAGNRRLFYWMQDKDADKDEVCSVSPAPAFSVAGVSPFRCVGIVVAFSVVPADLCL